MENEAKISDAKPLLFCDIDGVLLVGPDQYAVGSPNKFFPAALQAMHIMRDGDCTTDYLCGRGG